MEKTIDTHYTIIEFMDKENTHNVTFTEGIQLTALLIAKSGENYKYKKIKLSEDKYEVHLAYPLQIIRDVFREFKAEKIKR